MTQLPVSIEPIAVPSGLDAPGAADFIAVAELLNAQLREFWGNDDFYGPPQAQLAGRRSTPTRRRELLVARAGADIVGVAQINLPLTDNLHSGTVNVVVAPSARRRGVGTQLYAAAEQLAAADNRRMLMAETDHLPSGETSDPIAHTPSLVPQDAAALFASALGFRLELVDRVSRLELGSAADDEAVLEQARAVAGSDYELVFWSGACPPDLVDAYALLRQKMSIDAPMGGLDLAEEVWNEARVREAEAQARDMDAEVLVSAARQVATGELAGHTVLEIFRNNPAVVYQDDTLVLESHRGNRLGMLLKAANLVRLRQMVPEARRVYTWNAEENRYMLSINERLGFRPIGYSGEWQKELSAE
ncbi:MULTISPECIES: GNAT family N-acetyltransferase [unclassified Arthrobacter]|uniref:GNAT family N-acetyltransferase n=1 Tax=unclassified Arthrobacter TaxID=235627 RepID=UPI001D140E31|nr:MULTISPECIES: GNAT family N-acetyltransferase [unclassified Arthrobacter]MCC3290243.1 GNAT family N-acetyltransferase [Arthrobacter sp. zg-Y1110]MCC3300246.1 GNAT family N-acetyltransferase [Arthrobacter sp. zg-Y895]UWX84375.1 GNAT family N-acetyltransferase [Arthrobacter sp. zg-Y1110]